MAIHRGVRDLQIAALFPHLANHPDLFHTATNVFVARDLYNKLTKTIEKINRDCPDLTVVVEDYLPDGYITGMRKYPDGLGELELVYIEAAPQD